MKGLEAYEIVKEECGFAFGETANGDRVRANLPIIGKELIALNIIRTKKVNVLMFYGSETLEEYNKQPLSWYKLTQGEWNLLKEVLTNEEKS